MASEVNTLAKTFKINKLTVDYTTTEVRSLPSSISKAGQRLDVRGILSSGGTLATTRVKLADILGVQNADSADISGIVILYKPINQGHRGPDR